MNTHTPATFRGQRDQLFNDDWKFYKGDFANGQQPQIQDADWRVVDLPHDWSVEEPFQHNLASCTAYLPGGIAWYRKSFQLPSEMQNKKIAIRFDGVYENSQVWCNGHLLGRRPFGFISFEYDLTPYLNFSRQRNVIAVRVDHTNNADTRWYSGSGIYRNVFLTVTNPLCVATYGTFVTTPDVNEEQATVAIQTTVKNDAGATDVVLTSIVRDTQGSEIARAEDRKPIEGKGNATFSQRIRLPHPSLWSSEHPAIYDMDTLVKINSNVVDEYHTPFGVRTIRFDANRGFLLNGKATKLKGVCIHQDAGVLGAAIPIKVWERRLKALAEGGCNAIRMSHNPPAPELLDLCDRMGFLVMDEAFDEWTRGKKKWTNGHNRGQFSTEGYHSSFDEWAETDIRDMVRRDRNHPSIILWSIGNEIDFPNDAYPPDSSELPPIAAKLIKAVKEVDLTRPVTAACAAIKSNLFADQLDVVGYNYQEARYQSDHAAHPNRVIYGSENKLGIAPWQGVLNNEFISAQFLWTGVDYLGEAPGWPARGSSKGLLDEAGFEKPEFYLQKSLWTDQPMVYLDVGKDKLTCYSNCERIELFQDGKSLGQKPMPESRVLTWEIPSPPTGDLKAVGKTSSIDVCSFELKHPSEARQLLLHCYSENLTADGRDIAQIEVEVADASEVRVPTATNSIKCTVDGPGKFLGMESGNQSSIENYKSNEHQAYRGHMLIYVQAMRSAGQITVSVSSPGLDDGTFKIPVK